MLGVGDLAGGPGGLGPAAVGLLPGQQKRPALCGGLARKSRIAHGIQRQQHDGACRKARPVRESAAPSRPPRSGAPSNGPRHLRFTSGDRGRASRMAAASSRLVGLAASNQRLARPMAPPNSDRPAISSVRRAI